jgi:PKD repeat protein
VVTVRERLAARIEVPATAQEGDRVDVDGAGSTGSPTAYAWDLDGDGQHDDATGATASVVMGQDGQHTVGLQVTDGDGATAATTRTVEVANVLPVVELSSTATAVAGRRYTWTLDGTFTDPGTDAWTATVDTGEGDRSLPLLGRSSQLLHTFGAAGTQSVPVTVCDDDGCGTATVVVTVDAEQPVWPWQGSFTPVDPLPVVNTVKAGQAIPMKFSLGGDRGLAILAEGSPVSVRHGCDTSGGTDAIETTATPGASELSYDAATDRYQYVWKTQKGWTGQCRTFRMTLVDGSAHEAEFRFR